MRVGSRLIIGGMECDCRDCDVYRSRGPNAKLPLLRAEIVPHIIWNREEEAVGTAAQILYRQVAARRNIMPTDGFDGHSRRYWSGVEPSWIGLYLYGQMIS